MESVLGISFSTQLLFGLLAGLGAFIYWINRRQDYFKNLGIPYVPSTALLGSFDNVVLGKTGFYDQTVTLYNKPEVKDKPFFGIFVFHKPGLMVTDPELIKSITVRDFNSFPNRYTSSDMHDPLGYYTLFAADNPLWKMLRGKLSPFFTSGKLKSMYYLIDKISTQMVDYVEKRLDSENKVELEVKELTSLYSTDVVASCAFGVEANSLENPDGEFRTAGKIVFGTEFWRAFEFSAFFMLPQIMKVFRFKAFSHKVSHFIETSISHVMSERERTGDKRNDLIDTFIEMKKTESSTVENITMDMMMAQAAAFFSAGFETSSSTQSFALYEIAMHPAVQNKLRQEIKEMLNRTDGKVTYDSVMNTTEMPYLHQVVHETLRLYPILPVLDRQCVNPDGYSLEPLSDFKIPCGMPVYIPFYAIQRDPKYFPDPLQFDPERFSAENIGKIKPFTNFPFGSGPRNCIGERFGLMQVKTGIVKLLKYFRLETTEKTPKKIVLEKKSMVIHSDKGLFINYVRDPLHQKT